MSVVSLDSGRLGMSDCAKEHKKDIVSVISHHVLNVDLRVKLVISFIFTDIQRVKSWLFEKRNDVCS